MEFKERQVALHQAWPSLHPSLMLNRQTGWAASRVVELDFP